ncbi:hypothetical protein ACH5RR_015942 [Cinchona calisaya]|uniref:Uncharacterized protein n=1 Tax=Cinchona calisaya TaxID=153742 RepID=A0ABD2ZUY2_9GENT
MKGSEGPPAATIAERTEEKEEKCFEDHGLVNEVPLSCYLQNGPAAMISLLNSLMLVQAGGHMGLDINLQLPAKIGHQLPPAISAVPFVLQPFRSPSCSPYRYSSAIISTTNNITTDQSALFALRAQFSLIESHQILTKNWSVGSSVYEWIGVTCSSCHHRATALNISNMDLSSLIPPQLGNLSFLVSLDMSRNHFYGELPRGHARLRRLRVLNLGFNNLNGDLPSWLGSDDYLHLQVNREVQDDLEKNMHKETDDHISSNVWNNLTPQKSSYDSLKEK